ncbi:hypothetical protein ACFXB3_12590 [Streptomyces sp. NPDC059447]|uniref:hypothetical protein n=1 Tax=Streptomyces sp. NPDC059447 TaxID=3346834 RepID=UPI00368A14A2
MRGYRWSMAAVVVSAVLVSAAAGGVSAQARPAAAAAAAAGPVLEKIAPAGAVEVPDDKSCFTLTVKGTGFPAGRELVLDVGTDQAMGVLRGAPVRVTPDQAGAFGPTTFTPCGVTTHGSTESDFTCTDDRVRNGDCVKEQKGDVLQKGGRWFSRIVKVVAFNEEVEVMDPKERECDDPDICQDVHSVPERRTVRKWLAEADWPLKVTGTK